MAKPPEDSPSWPGDEELEQFARLIGVPLPEEHRDGVRVHLEAALAMAKLVYAVPLPDDELAPAPVFAASLEPPE
ncbi:MAG: DUF4089 domain-containing protein [Pseudomonadota bacterium]